MKNNGWHKITKLENIKISNQDLPHVTFEKLHMSDSRSLNK